MIVFAEFMKNLHFVQKELILFKQFVLGTDRNIGHLETFGIDKVRLITNCSSTTIWEAWFKTRSTVVFLWHTDPVSSILMALIENPGGSVRASIFSPIKENHLSSFD